MTFFLLYISSEFHDKNASIVNHSNFLSRFLKKMKEKPKPYCTTMNSIKKTKANDFSSGHHPGEG